VSAVAGGVLEISRSPWRTVGLMAAGLLLTALSASVAFHLLPDRRAGLYEQFISYVLVALFAQWTFIIAWRSLTVGGAVVTVTPEGIRDTRVAAELIPWTAIERISTWQHRGPKVLVLAVDPEVERGLSLTRMACWSRKVNRALGADGLCIEVRGLSIGYDKLLQTCMAYAQNARPSEA
jgi:hypothetical protein